MSHPLDPGGPHVSPVIEPAIDALDVHVLHDLLATLVQPVAVAAIYRKFAENAAEFVRGLPDQEDTARIDTLHTLKGTAATMGAKRLALLAARLQVEAESRSVQVAEAMQALTEELAKFRVAATARLADLGVRLEL